MFAKVRSIFTFVLSFDHSTRYSDALCGRLQCANANEKPVYGNNSLESIGGGAKCRVVTYNFGETATDTEPGMVPDGAKCGVDKVRRHYVYMHTYSCSQMCSNVHCVRTRDVLKVNACESLNCSNKGVCNNLGHCHCEAGYGGWDCSSLGAGQCA